MAMPSRSEGISKFPHRFDFKLQEIEYDPNILRDVRREDFVRFRGHPDFYNFERQWLSANQRNPPTSRIPPLEAHHVETKPNKLLLLTGI